MVKAEEYWITARCITRSDGALGKKQVWRSHVRTSVFSEANVLHWSRLLVTLLRLFGATLSFGALIVTPLTRRPGNCAAWPRRNACDYCAQRRTSTIPWYIALTRDIRETLCFSRGNFSIFPNFCATLRKTNWKVLQDDGST